MQIATVILCLCLIGCGQGGKSRAETYTLYRNSFLDSTTRIHWATFDAADRENYNMGNCLMAARLLNANVNASAMAEGKPRDLSLGFWCEEGKYRESGAVPTTFTAAFPTDV